MDAFAYAKFLAALFFVLALIIAVAWIARRSGLIPSSMMKRPAADKRRLAVSEVLPLDSKRRLLLVSRDGTEHLILLGPHGETLIEQGIEPGIKQGIASTSPNKNTEPTPDQAI